jgi:hypothetical protein
MFTLTLSSDARRYIGAGKFGEGMMICAQGQCGWPKSNLMPVSDMGRGKPAGH